MSIYDQIICSHAELRAALEVISSLSLPEISEIIRKIMVRFSVDYIYYVLEHPVASDSIFNIMIVMSGIKLGGDDISTRFTLDKPRGEAIYTIKWSAASKNKRSTGKLFRFLFDSPRGKITITKRLPKDLGAGDSAKLVAAPILSVTWKTF